MTSMTGAVVVASNRAAAGVYDDETGPLLVEFLTGLGFETGAPAVVADGEDDLVKLVTVGELAAVS